MAGKARDRLADAMRQVAGRIDGRTWLNGIDDSGSRQTWYRTKPIKFADVDKLELFIQRLVDRSDVSRVNCSGLGWSSVTSETPLRGAVEAFSIDTSSRRSRLDIQVQMDQGREYQVTFDRSRARDLAHGAVTISTDLFNAAPNPLTIASLIDDHTVPRSRLDSWLHPALVEPADARKAHDELHDMRLQRRAALYGFVTGGVAGVVSSLITLWVS